MRAGRTRKRTELERRQRKLWCSMAANRNLREHSRLSQNGWSHWKRAMVPNNSNALTHRLKRRDSDQQGWMCRSIRKAFLYYANHCGVYEWRVRGTRDDQPTYVVYIGSTCRSKRGALRARILEYCRNGSHKMDLFNRALQRGYEMWVRVKVSRGRRTAEKEENALLARYNYAWNKRRNGNIRDIL